MGAPYRAWNVCTYISLNSAAFPCKIIISKHLGNGGKRKQKSTIIILFVVAVVVVAVVVGFFFLFVGQAKTLRNPLNYHH